MPDGEIKPRATAATLTVLDFLPAWLRVLLKVG